MRLTIIQLQVLTLSCALQGTRPSWMMRSRFFSHLQTLRLPVTEERRAMSYRQAIGAAVSDLDTGKMSKP